MPLRALKIAVVVMGIMLVGGVAVLVAVIAGRLSRGPAVAPASLSAAPVELPADARIETIGVGAERLAIAVLMPDGTRELIILDIASGRRLGKIPLGKTQ